MFFIYGTLIIVIIHRIYLISSHIKIQHCGGQSVVHLTNSPTYENETIASVYKIGY
jgi:hypothetical protein